MENLKAQILKARVNSFIGIVFLGSAATLASVVILQATFGENAIAKAFERHYAPILQAIDK